MTDPPNATDTLEERISKLGHIELLMHYACLRRKHPPGEDFENMVVYMTEKRFRMIRLFEIEIDRRLKTAGYADLSLVDDLCRMPDFSERDD